MSVVSKFRIENLLEKFLEPNVRLITSLVGPHLTITMLVTLNRGGGVAISFARLDSDIVDYLYLKSHSRVARHGRVVWPPLLAPSRRVTVSGSLPVRSHLLHAEFSDRDPTQNEK
jgi:hypothetical protein